MLNSIETDVNKYMIQEDSKDLFHNISLFSKNMLLKNEEKYDKAETDLSKWWGDLFLKYCKNGLSYEDIGQMFVFIDEYNNTIDNIIEPLKNGSSSGKEDAYTFILKAWGLYSTQEYGQSILYILTRSFFNWVYNTKMRKDIGVNLEKDNLEALVAKYILVNIFKSNKLQSNGYVFSLSDNIINNYTNIPNFIVSFDYQSNISTIANGDVIDALLNEFFFTRNTTENTIDINQDIIGTLVTLINKEYIYYFTPPQLDDYYNPNSAYNNKEKLSATTEEMSVINSGEQVMLFDLVLKQDKIMAVVDSTIGDKFLSPDSLSSSNNIDSQQTGLPQVCIVYKELNPEYRDAIDAEAVEIALNSYNSFSNKSWDSPDQNGWVMNNFISALNKGSGKTCHISKYAESIIRKVENSVINDFLSIKFGKEVGYSYSVSNEKTNIYYDGTLFNTTMSAAPVNGKDIYLAKLKKYITTINVPEDNLTNEWYVLSINDGAEKYGKKFLVDIANDTTIAIYTNSRYYKELAGREGDTTIDGIEFTEITQNDPEPTNLDDLWDQGSLPYWEADYSTLFKNGDVLVFKNKTQSTDQNQDTDQNADQINQFKFLYTAVDGNESNYKSEILPYITAKEFTEDIDITNKLYQYRYTNPYIARSAEESDIISYYIADTYISNGYGRFKYQKEEINIFLDIFRETREYFFKVLDNESFINDDNYKLYQKLFLIYWSIERMMSNKLKSIHDVNTYDYNDIKNFLVSYGFEGLTEFIDNNSFYNDEEYAKNIVKKFIDLTQNKGSRKVIDVLEKVFTLDDSTLRIYKYILFRNTTAGEDTKDYKILKTDYDTDNTIYDIKSRISFAIDLDTATEGDKYWDSKKNTPASLLDDIGLYEPVTTKYIVPELTLELSERYVVTRTLLAVIDYYTKLLNGDFDENTSTSESSSTTENNEGATGTSEQTSGNTKLITMDDIKIQGDLIVQTDVSLKEYIELLRCMYKKYFDILLNSNRDIVCKHTYRINREYFNDNLKKYYIRNENNTSILNPYSLNEIKIAEDFPQINSGTSKNDSGDDTITAIKTVLGMLMPLRLTRDDINKNKSAIESSTNDFIQYYVLDLVNANLGRVRGIFHDINCTYTAYSKIIEWLDNIFISQEEPTGNIKEILQPEANEETIDSDLDSSINPEYNNPLDIDTIKNGIVEMCRTLSSILGSTVSLNLSATDSTVTEFLEKAIKYFISYTSDILDFKYINSYDTYSESACDAYEEVYIETKMLEMDSVLNFDERFNIREDRNEEEEEE